MSPAWMDAMFGMWKMNVADRPGEAYFPNAVNWVTPFGTKDSWISPEEALRWYSPWLGKNYKGQLKSYVHERKAHLIGDGIIAPPPCSPQPFCQLIEGQTAPPQLFLLATVPSLWSKQIGDQPTATRTNSWVSDTDRQRFVTAHRLMQLGFFLPNLTSNPESGSNSGQHVHTFRLHDGRR